MEENRKKAKDELLEILGKPGNTLGEARVLLRASGKNLALSYDEKTGHAMLQHVELSETFQFDLETPTFRDLYYQLTKEA